MGTGTSVSSGKEHRISFSGSEVRVYAAFSNAVDSYFSDSANNGSTKAAESPIVELPELQTVSYSVYRNTQSVYRLGQSTPSGVSKSTVTIAGTMIFTVFNEHVLNSLTKKMSDKKLSHPYENPYQSEYDAYFNRDTHNTGVPDVSVAKDKYIREFYSMRADELPLLDIFITMENEYGMQSRMSIYGVQFMNEGQVHSIHDLITENSLNYLAREIIPMHKVSDGNILQIHEGTNLGDKLTRKDYTQAKDHIKQLRKGFL